jgi:quercetin dioxygenase-like cupin family protein
VKTLNCDCQFSYPALERDWEVLDVFGPTLQFPLAPNESAEIECLMRGTIPPGVSIPLHSHDDFEYFYVISGNVNVLLETAKGLEWLGASAGDFVRIPGGRKHASRNICREPATFLILTTARLGHFFQEIGECRAPGTSPRKPTASDLQHFVSAAARYGYWLAAAEENAAAGITVS